MRESHDSRRSAPDRRIFIRQSSLFLCGSALAWNVRADLVAAEAAAKPRVRIGLVTDLHYADKAPAGTRHYRASSAKLAEAAERFRQERMDLVIELGDVIDSADSLEVEQDYLRRIAKEFRTIPGQHHFVLGNHCVFNLTKDEFLEVVGQKQASYSFDLGGYHFVVLDACFRKDGVPYGRQNFTWTDALVPAAEAAWLRADLAQTRHKTLVFVHQRLDVEPPYGVSNAPEIRQILEESGRVLAVFQGHHHRGDYQEIRGIHYCTLAAMIEGPGPESNAYAILDILPGDTLRLTGFRKQRSYAWA